MPVKAPNGNGVAPKEPTAPVAVESNSRGIGRTGLRQWSGRIDEEFLKELKNDRKYQVYKEMSENDPIVGAVLRAIEFLIRGVAWRIEPEDQEDDANRQLAEDIEKRIHGMRRSWSEILVEILSFLPYGWSFHEILYESKPDGVYWADWPIRSQDTLLKWEFEKDAEGKDTDRFVAMTQQIPTDTRRTRTIPLEKGLLFRLESHKNNPEGRSILRNAYLPWYYKTHLSRIEAIGIERYLAGYPVLYVPGEVLDTPNSPAYAAAQKIVTNIKRDEQEGALLSSARDQSGNLMWELKLVAGDGGETVAGLSDKAIQRYDQRIAMTCLADFVLLGHEKVGSFALAGSKTDVFALALAAILDSICGTINRYAIPRLAELNGWPAENLPKLVHGDIEMPDLQELGAYITALSGAGIPLFPDMKLENRLRELGGLPTLNPEEFDEREAQAKADQQMQMQMQADLAAAGKAPPGEKSAAGDKPKPADEAAKSISKDGAGRWVTINGTPVFIEAGQSVGDAVNEQFGGDAETPKPSGRGVTGEQRDAASRYQEREHREVNAALRGQRSETGDTKATTKHLDSLIGNQSPLTKDMMVYRGMTAQPFSKMEPGMTITDKGFVSTSASEKTAVGFAPGKAKGAIVHIRVPAGKRALHLGKVTGDNVEQEYLLPRNSRFRVTEIRRTPGQRAVVTMEVL
jgi:Protein of unknown function (DUF935)./NAD:arginine ADP-ribosyltransferase.